MSKYRVIKSFIDLQDGNHLYVKGDSYKGSVAKKRIEELTSTHNKRGEVLIEEVKKRKAPNKSEE